jgi:hypothetical protein
MFDFEQLERIERSQHVIIKLLHRILKGEHNMSAELDALTAEVAATASVEASAVALIQGIAAKLATATAANDTPAIVALTTSLTSSADALAAAIAANTPAAPVANVA